VKYRTLVIDPPWLFDQQWATNGPQPYAGKTLYRKPRGAIANYALLSIEDIAAIPVGEWAEAENAHMYLWTTNTFMVEAHRLMEAWDFRQKTILTWVKPRLGMGTYYRNNTEHVLFGVRPKSPVLRKDCRTAFEGAQGRHSEKPAAFYDMVQSMSPPPYLDVFARKLRFNFDAWGDEVGAPDGLPTPQEVAATHAGEED
jgi:N6-adenosine-specific RNA methylase IME4